MSNSEVINAIVDAIEDQKPYTVRKVGFMKYEIIFEEQSVQTVPGEAMAEMVADGLNKSFAAGFATGLMSVVGSMIPEDANVQVRQLNEDEVEALERGDLSFTTNDEEDKNDPPTYH